MADYANSGRLGKNRRREEGTKQPEYTGELRKVICPHCKSEQDFWLSAWVREHENGRFFSLAVKPKDVQPSPKPREPEWMGQPPAQLDDDIPF